MKKTDNFEKNIKYNSESFSGTLNIGVRGNACEIFLPKILHEFHLLYPKVIINILMKTSDEEVEDNQTIKTLEDNNIHYYLTRKS